MGKVKSYLVIGTIFIALIASVFVFADTLGVQQAVLQDSTVSDVQVLSNVSGVITESSTAQDVQLPMVPSNLPSGMQRIQVCKQVTWDEHAPIYSNCTTTYNQTNCSDAPVNKSCTTVQNSFTYSCINGSATVTKQRQDCATTGFMVSGKFINTTDYRCAVTTDGKEFVTCDSIYDGNGDGICTSGESCIQFGIVGNYIVRKERNSQDQFVDSDNSFFLPRTEVTQ